MLKIVICDDNKAILSSLSELIKQKIKADFVLNVFSNTFALYDYVFEIAKGSIDVLITDIDLGDENGVSVAAEVKQRYPHVKIIFISGHLNLALDVFDVEPVYFLYKPIDPERLVKAFEKTVAMIEADKKNCVSIVYRGEIVNVEINRIKYIESQKRHVIIHESDYEREAAMKLDEIECKLPGNFLRCHQSYIVNMDRVKNFSIKGAEIYGGGIVPISRPKYKEVKKLFLSYMGGQI